MWSRSKVSTDRLIEITANRRWGSRRSVAGMTQKHFRTRSSSRKVIGLASTIVCLLWDIENQSELYNSKIEISGSSDGTTCHQEDSKSSFNESGNVSTSTQRFVTFADRLQPQQPLQSGFNSVRRGLHNFMSSMDAALKHSTQTTPGRITCFISLRPLDKCVLFLPSR